MAISIRQRLTDAALSRLLAQSGALHGYAVEQVWTPMRDGVMLAGDHFVPETDAPRGTVLIRTPYGRGFPTSAVNGRLFAARGYHVVIQSVRGTFGSGGEFRPMAQETDDGRDTVAWLRDQPWFDGRLATLGGSYLGWTQWSLLQDPPPELQTAVVYVGPHDFRRAVFGTGAFTLGDFLGWSAQMAREDSGPMRQLLTMASNRRRLQEALDGLPLPDAADPLLEGRAPWYRQWLSHPDADDPWWEPYRADAALDRVDVPVLIVAGWQDLFLEQSIEQYEKLHARGVDVALTVGPWTHFQVSVHGAPRISRETLAWLDRHMAGGPEPRKASVHVHRTGEHRWHELETWPPSSTPTAFHLHPDRTMTAAPSSAALPLAEPSSAALTSAALPLAEPSSADSPAAAPTTDALPAAAPTTDALPAAALASAEPASDFPSSAEPTPTEPPPSVDPSSAEPPFDGTVSFRYDPKDPTPAVGGRTLSGSTGVRDNRRLETRPDVVTFTSAPLPEAVDVVGSPTVELAVAVDVPHADVFVRLCDVDPRGRSRNFSDLLVRLDAAHAAGAVQHLTLTLDPCFHRLAAGHRLRLQVSGGAFPRFARNLGTPGTPAEGHVLRASVHTIHCDRSRVILPVGV